MPAINVISFDFDGCIFNPTYHANKANKEKSPEQVLKEANQSLFSTLREAIKEERPREVILMVGSNRQSYSSDGSNSVFNGTGSCFPTILSLIEVFNQPDIPCRVDKYLLADAYDTRADKKPGKSFEDAMKVEPLTSANMHQVRAPQPDWVFDKSKLTILYAQMHKIASENSDAKITYDSYDDRKDAILSHLQTFFTNNPDLIPKNVTLRLHHYDGTLRESFEPIQGNGRIDSNYEDNVKRMVACANISPIPITGPNSRKKPEYDVRECLQNKNGGLQEFKDKRFPTRDRAQGRHPPQPKFSASSESVDKSPSAQPQQLKEEKNTRRKMANYFQKITSEVSKKFNISPSNSIANDSTPNNPTQIQAEKPRLKR